MASEHDSPDLITFFDATIFVPVIVVVVLILLAVWLLDAWSWLSYKVHEYRARRRMDATLAENVENAIVENGTIELPRMGRQGADLGRGPQRGEGPGSNTDELPVPAKRFTEERVWWALDL